MEYQGNEPQLIKYLHKVQDLSTYFESFEVKYVPREQNSWANLLSKLSNTKTTWYNQTVIQQSLTPSIKVDNIYALEASLD